MIIRFSACLILLFFLIPGGLWAKDMRISVEIAREKRTALLEKAAAEKKMAQQEALENQKKILADKNSLQMAIVKLKKQNKEFQKNNKQLIGELDLLKKEEIKISASLAEIDAVVKELAGLVKVNARELDTLLLQSPQSIIFPDRRKSLTSLLTQNSFPGMADIEKMFELLFQEIQAQGEVKMLRNQIVDRKGIEITADILMLGNFTASYQSPDESGFLLYSDNSQRLFALSKLPSTRLCKKINKYMDGHTDTVPIDISRGAALRQLTHKLSLFEQIPKGGPIVWPIIGIFILAVLIILERFFYLIRKDMNPEKLMGKIDNLIMQGKWTKCRELCDKYHKRPLSKVLLAGINFKDAERIDIENALQETILREIPPLERFMSTLGMLAAIAPLLGLLGTVTGMINTFQAITFFGTGNPRTMSGGISEALVTTMLGLTVAIPIMLCHTILSRKVENLIAKMEEKGVTLVNLIFKAKENS